jgi:hypothetical protein
MKVPSRVAIARGIAVLVDAVQIVVLPAVLGGAASPLEDALDVAAGALMIFLVGWHLAFLPTFVSELIPALDLFPTWTAAVFFVTRHRRASAA